MEELGEIRQGVDKDYNHKLGFSNLSAKNHSHYESYKITYKSYKNYRSDILGHQWHEVQALVYMKGYQCITTPIKEWIALSHVYTSIE